MTIEGLTVDVENFKNELLQIKNKRDRWANVTKTLLMDTLRKVKAKFDLEWNAYVMDTTANSEGVNLTFSNSPSGIYEKTEKGMKAYNKKGGTLVFSQAYNGDVFIIILYPSVDELVIPFENHKLVLKVAPEKIDESFIYEQVSTFLREMALWESSSAYHPIGFSTKKTYIGI